MAVGTGEVDFGAAPGAFEATLVVTGQATIASNSHVEAYIMRETPSDSATTHHTAADMALAPHIIKLVCGNIVAATGFTIYASSSEKIHGKIPIHWVWA